MKRKKKKQLASNSINYLRQNGRQREIGQIQNDTFIIYTKLYPSLILLREL